MRKDPSGTPPLVELKDRGKWVTQTRQYELITPLFGGGVNPAEADEVTVVRGAEVRGQLRFWWRATRGGQFGGDLDGLDRMKRAEDLLWGAASTPKDPRPSQVQVVVKTLNKGTPFESKDRNGHRVHIGSPSSIYGYAAFPLNDKHSSVVLQGVQFELTITFPKSDAAEVEAALWAWETFGGLGARTRRGFGALRCTHVNGNPNNSFPPTSIPGAEKWIRDKLNKHILAESWFPNVPHLSRTMEFRVTQLSNNALQVWWHLINRLKDFRHQRPQDRGRNRWPEPDEIRRRTRKYSDRHRAVISEVRKFPRATFGLPIIFEFKRDDQRAGDPPGKNTLTGQSHDGQKDYERLASPLIFRPLSCGGTTVVGLALILEGSKLPDRLTLSNGIGLVQADLTPEEAEQIMMRDDQTPLLGRQTNVLLAFLDHLGRR